MQPDTQSAEAWLLGFRGPFGKCARLELDLQRLADMDSEIPMPGCGSNGVHVSGGSVSDPTECAAASLSAARERLQSEADSLMDEIAEAGIALRECPHGELLDAYFLQPDERVTVGLVADELGISHRTAWRWKSEALAWLGTVKPWSD